MGRLHLIKPDEWTDEERMCVVMLGIGETIPEGKASIEVN
jgi:hypothetical protein